MKAVSRFEANLLRVLRAMLMQASPAQWVAILAKPMVRPSCLSADAVALAEDMLAKGMVRWLARRGWATERYLRDGTPTTGRLWDRTPPATLGLRFSRWTMEFLLQLVTNTLGAKKPKANELELGDRLVFLLVYSAAHHEERGDALRKDWPTLWSDGLCRLTFAEELPDGKTPVRIDWAPWLSESGTAILEALQPLLAERWAALEVRKQTFRNLARVRQVGATQTRVIGEYCDALALANRRDLSRCLLDAGQRVMRDRPPASRWIAGLDLKRERLADRVGIYRDALAFAHCLDRLRVWNEEASRVSYYDEGYAASQLWKADWERFAGETTCGHAAEILREVRPI